MALSDPVRIRRIVCAACMIAAPLVGLIAAIVEPKRHEDGDEAVREISQHASALAISVFLYLVSSALLVFAVLGLMQMARERARLGADVGGALTIVGILAITTLLGLRWVHYHLGEAGDAEEMASVYERMYSGAGIALLYLIAALLSVGSIVLAIVLVRARLIPLWSAGLIVIGAVLLQVAYALLDGGSGKALAIAAFACSLAGLGPIGWLMLRRGDEAWRHPPDYSGLQSP